METGIDLNQIASMHVRPPSWMIALLITIGALVVWFGLTG
jgi:hypothetical protein